MTYLSGWNFGLFCSTSTTTGYRDIRLVENRKWTEWPQTELEHLTVKSTLHMLSTYPWGPNVGPFRSTISCFQDTTCTMSAKTRNALNDPKLNLSTWLHKQRFDNIHVHHTCTCIRMVSSFCFIFGNKKAEILPKIQELFSNTTDCVCRMFRQKKVFFLC